MSVLWHEEADKVLCALLRLKDYIDNDPMHTASDEIAIDDAIRAIRDDLGAYCEG